MKVLSVNLGRPAEIALSTSTVPTGLFKQPIEGRIRVLFDRLAGDYSSPRKYEYGGPTQAVCVYQIENFDFWRRHIDAPDYGPGFFGENFTVEDMPDDRVCIGDIYRFGSALLQVSKHRPPCRRLSARIGDPAFVKEYLLSRRLGFYMRVLEEGEVAAGDAIELIEADPVGVSVAEYGALLDIDHSDAESLHRAIEIKSLEDSHRKRIEGFLQNL